MNRAVVAAHVERYMPSATNGMMTAPSSSSSYPYAAFGKPGFVVPAVWEVGSDDSQVGHSMGIVRRPRIKHYSRFLKTLFRYRTQAE